MLGCRVSARVDPAAKRRPRTFAVSDLKYVNDTLSDEEQKDLALGRRLLAGAA